MEKSLPKGYNSPFLGYSMNYCIKIHFLLFFGLSVCFSESEENGAKFNALYITNFAKYIEWPDDSTVTSFRIVIIGDDPVIHQLNSIAKHISIRGLKLVVETCDTLESRVTPHIIYIPARRSSDLPAILEIVKNKPVLIVTNKKGLAEQGAGININNLYWKLRYEINVKNLQAHNLSAHDVLFELGRVIQ